MVTFAGLCLIAVGLGALVFAVFMMDKSDAANGASVLAAIALGASASYLGVAWIQLGGRAELIAELRAAGYETKTDAAGKVIAVGLLAPTVPTATPQWIATPAR